MKKICVSCNAESFQILKDIHDRICSVKNINSEIFHCNNYNIEYENIINKYDAFIVDSNFDKTKFSISPTVDNLILKKNDKFETKNIFYFSLLYLIDTANINLEGTNILLIENSEIINSISKIFFDRLVKKIYVATNDFSNKIFYNKNIQKIKYSEISNLNNISIVINLSGIDDLFSNNILFNNSFNRNIKLAIDLNIFPSENTFQYFFMNIKIDTISGFLIKIVEILKTLSLLFDRDDIIYNEFIKQIFVNIKKNYTNKDIISNYEISNTYIDMFKGVKNNGKK